MAGRRFNPSAWSTLAAVAGIAATVALGLWQLGRAQEKAGLVATRLAGASGPAVHLGQAPTDPATFAVVSAVLAGIALFATYIPAYRASCIDPASSLKAE